MDEKDDNRVQRERKEEKIHSDKVGEAPFWRNLAAKIVSSEITGLEEK